MTEVAIPAGATATDERTILAIRNMYDPDLDFEKLVIEAGSDAFYTRGFRLVDKDWLLGVPHAIIGVTYRPGFKNKDTGVVGDYISVEAVVASEGVLNSIPVKSQLPDELNVYPNEAVIYNDGGTGVRRKLTEVFQALSLIDVGPSRKKGEVALDKPFSLWLAGQDTASSGIYDYVNADGERKPFRYVALRGLRKSEYSNEYTPAGETATTYYFG